MRKSVSKDFLSLSLPRLTLIETNKGAPVYITYMNKRIFYIEYYFGCDLQFTIVSLAYELTMKMRKLFQEWDENYYTKMKTFYFCRKNIFYSILNSLADISKC